MPTVIVSDTGPLIALAKIDHLRLLHSLFHEIMIPTAVHQELLAKAGPETSAIKTALSTFIQTSSVSSLSAEVTKAVAPLGPGEQEAIALAHTHRATLIIDERLGRSAALGLGIQVSGVVGVLLLAKEIGQIPSIAHLLGGMRDNGYWLSDRLIRHALIKANER